MNVIFFLFIFCMHGFKNTMKNIRESERTQQTMVRERQSSLVLYYAMSRKKLQKESWLGCILLYAAAAACLMNLSLSLYLCARLFRMKKFLIKKRAKNERNMIIIEIFQLVDALPKALNKKLPKIVRSKSSSSSSTITHTHKKNSCQISDDNEVDNWSCFFFCKPLKQKF